MKTKKSESSLGKYLYSGIGHISHAKDAVQNSIKSTSKKESNETAGREIIQNAFTSIEQKYNGAVHALKQFGNNGISRLQEGMDQFEKQLLVDTNTNGKKRNMARVSSTNGRNHAMRRPTH